MSNGSARPLWGAACKPTRRSAEEEFLRQPDGCLVDDCNRPPHPGLERVVLCDHHISRLNRDLRDLAPSVDLPRTPYDRAVAFALKREATEMPRKSVVYYIRFAEHIKIGTTINLRNRFASYSVHPDTLLAVEPGDMVTEQQRHAMFQDEKVRRPRERVRGGRELFDPSPRLLDHIDHVRSLFGDPKDFL